MPDRAPRVPAFTIARSGAAAMLFIALASLPYSYYTLMRFAVCMICGYGAFLAFERKHQPWMWAFGLTALLFNPFAPVRLDRSTWAVLDVAAGLLILASLGNRALIQPVSEVLPPSNDERDASVADSPDVSPVAEAEQIVNKADDVVPPTKAELVAQREMDQRRRAAENERLRKWQDRVYKK